MGRRLKVKLPRTPRATAPPAQLRPPVESSHDGQGAAPRGIEPRELVDEDVRMDDAPGSVTPNGFEVRATFFFFFITLKPRVE